LTNAACDGIIHILITNRTDNNMKAMIADIQRASVHDGPGLRTTVFFKGCPLNCVWCHNPECISFDPQILEYPDKCIGCGFCDDGCFSGAKVVCGKEMTTDEVLRQILLDRDYYKDNGGVTFTGGEPMCYTEFLHELIDKCKSHGIHVAMETSMLIYDENLFTKLDLIMADLKIWDDDEHIKYTGVSNKTIKENFIRVNKLNIPLIVRTPVIPEINAAADNIRNIANFLRDMENVTNYELLPYHPLGLTKLNALNIKDYTQYEIPSKKLIEELKIHADLQRTT